MFNTVELFFDGLIDKTEAINRLRYVSENVGITTAQTMKLLGIKQRRAREILVKMVENGWLKKEGASRSTIYVKNTEGR